MSEYSFRLVDKLGRSFDVTLGEVVRRPSGDVQTVWLGDDLARTLQADQVTALAACQDKASWKGWEAILATVD